MARTLCSRTCVSSRRARTDIGLTPGQVEAGKVFTGEGHGGAWEDEKETLAAIIEAINERFGTTSMTGTGWRGRS